jgi:hypothetical protein
MSDYNSCPNCGRRADNALSSNWFPVHTCRKCGKKFCDDCGEGNGTICPDPDCGSANYSDYDKVYAED